MPPRPTRASRGAESSDGDGGASAWFGQQFGTGSADSAVTLTQQLATVGEPEQAARLREVQARPAQLRQQIQAAAAAHDAEQRRSRPPFVRSNLLKLVLRFTMALARKFSLR